MWRSTWKLVIFVAVCLCSLSESQSDVFQRPEKRAPRRYCGGRLVDILQLVCDGFYFTHLHPTTSSNINNKNQKKSIPEMDDDFWLQINPVEEQLKFPFRSRSVASTFMHRILKRNSGSSTGVVYECCINKGCTIQELRSYCASPPDQQ